MKYFAFLIRRPQDKQPWPVIFENSQQALAYSSRVSDLYEVEMKEGFSDAVPGDRDTDRTPIQT